MTDTDRINWLDENAATLHAVVDDIGLPIGFAVHHEATGWMKHEKTARAAIDAAERGLRAVESPPTPARSLPTPTATR